MSAEHGVRRDTCAADPAVIPLAAHNNLQDATMKQYAHRAIYILSAIAALIAIVSFTSGISSIPSFLSSDTDTASVERKSTKDLFYFFLDNYRPELIDKFTSSILQNDRETMLLLITELIDSSKTIREEDSAKNWKYLIKNSPDNLTNDLVARFIAILAKERNALKKAHTEYVALINKVIRRKLKANNANIATGGLDTIDDDFLRSMGFPIVDYPGIPKYYFCNEIAFSVSKDYIFDRFYSTGLQDKPNEYLFSSGWTYQKVANEICAKHLLALTRAKNGEIQKARTLREH